MTYLIDLRELRDLWSMEYSERQADHLQIFASSCCADVSWLCTYIIDDASL